MKNLCTLYKVTLESFSGLGKHNADLPDICVTCLDSKKRDGSMDHITLARKLMLRRFKDLLTINESVLQLQKKYAQARKREDSPVQVLPKSSTLLQVSYQAQPLFHFSFFQSFLSFRAYYACHSSIRSSICSFSCNSLGLSSFTSFLKYSWHPLRKLSSSINTDTSSFLISSVWLKSLELPFLVLAILDTVFCLSYWV